MKPLHLRVVLPLPEAVSLPTFRLRLAARGRQEGRRRGGERHHGGGRRQVCPERVLPYHGRHEGIRDNHFLNIESEAPS
jgi:hypothetical protein